MTTHPQANLDPTTPTPQDPKPFFPKPKTTTELLLLGFPSTDAGSEILSFPHEPSIPGGIGARISLENKAGTCLRNLQLFIRGLRLHPTLANSILPVCSSSETYAVLNPFCHRLSTSCLISANTSTWFIYMRPRFFRNLSNQVLTVFCHLSSTRCKCKPPHKWRITATSFGSLVRQLQLQ